MSGAHLLSADLTEADLRKTDLSGADLRYARIFEANMEKANLSGADLTGAHLGRGTNLNGANLEGADMSSTICGNTIFGNVDLSNVKGLNSFDHVGHCTVGADTLYRSKGKIPVEFLRGCGVPEDLITFTRLLVGRPRTMQDGFVALLDVLGFRSLASDDGKGERLQIYLRILQTALEPDAGGPDVAAIVFSDSIVLTTEDDSNDSLQVLLRRCSRLFGQMLQQQIPLRGAVAHGPFLRQAVPGGVFVAGRAIIDAFTFETAQDWIGIMIAPSAVKRVPELRERCKIGHSTDGLQGIRERLAWAAFVQPYPVIPFHKNHPLEENVFDGFAVVPSDGNPQPPALRESLDRSIKALNWLKFLAPDPAAQAKYRKSCEFLDLVYQNWRWVADSWNKPER
jgi:hypothetical protein